MMPGHTQIYRQHQQVDEEAEYPTRHERRVTGPEKIVNGNGAARLHTAYHYTRTKTPLWTRVTVSQGQADRDPYTEWSEP